MKKIIFVMSIAIIALSMSACKTRTTDSQKVSTTVLVDDNTLKKVDSSALVEKHWKLIELFGNLVPASENKAREAYITFRIEGNQINGNGGCNRFAGSYQLKTPDKLVLSQVAATRMMCIDNMDMEDKFMQVLNSVDSYTIKNDTLTLNNAQMTSLARFVAVDMK